MKKKQTATEYAEGLSCYAIKYTGSDKSAHVLLSLLNKLRKRDKMEGFAEHSIYYMKPKIF